MIPKASQRGGGKDLATHLLNAFDNELVEVAEVSGAIAPDLHGAFAEWEAIAAGLTKCRNYLYSLSVNPDGGQGQLSRAQYMDYIDRVEKALGLSASRGPSSTTSRTAGSIAMSSGHASTTRTKRPSISPLTARS